MSCYSEKRFSTAWNGLLHEYSPNVTALFDQNSRFLLSSVLGPLLDDTLRLPIPPNMEPFADALQQFRLRLLIRVEELFDVFHFLNPCCGGTFG
jgi:hypothetical protein